MSFSSLFSRGSKPTGRNNVVAAPRRRPRAAGFEGPQFTRFLVCELELLFGTVEPDHSPPGRKSSRVGPTSMDVATYCCDIICGCSVQRPGCFSPLDGTGRHTHTPSRGGIYASRRNGLIYPGRLDGSGSSRRTSRVGHPRHGRRNLLIYKWMWRFRPASTGFCLVRETTRIYTPPVREGSA